MDITGVKVRLVQGAKQKVKAFCTVTIDDCFVVKDIKVIEGDKGEFIAMPSRKLSEKCGKCGRKNPVDSSFCSSCGTKLPASARDAREGSPYSDIAHPVNAECRSMMQMRVIDAYREALAESVPVAELVGGGPPREPVDTVPQPVAEDAAKDAPAVAEPAADAPSVAEPEPGMGNEADPSEEEISDDEAGSSFADGIYNN